MSVSGPRILLIEDNEQLAGEVCDAMRAESYAVDWIADGESALSAPFGRYALVILDVMLPGANGFEILAHLRAQDVRVPVLVLSAHNDTRDKVRALELGADDYVTKPFWPQELVARVKARLRRPELRTSSVLSIGTLSILQDSRTVQVDGRPVELTRLEFDLIASLARRRGSTVSRRWLLEQVLGEGVSTERTLDVHVSRLRKKLGPAGEEVVTVWGVGYRLGREA